MNCKATKHSIVSKTKSIQIFELVFQKMANLWKEEAEVEFGYKFLLSSISV